MDTPTDGHPDRRRRGARQAGIRPFMILRKVQYILKLRHSRLSDNDRLDERRRGG
ncbi:hypothetical protein [Methanoculleus chikugoensis]|uniref:hypothetical protein n=1 Tax=Methanoculleus chikugoensis TaxID=118126 RepID=UPI001FB4DE37|nr:hypothetical protein [Methanoculleus chikugoensis]